MRNGPSRSSKVVDVGTNRKRVCDFLLVINSILGNILPSFRDISGFLRRAIPPLFHPNFRGVPFGLDYLYICCGSEERRPYARSNYSCNYFRTNSTYAHDTITLRTDRRTNGRTTYALALRASRGKHQQAFIDALWCRHSNSNCLNTASHS